MRQKNERGPRVTVSPVQGRTQASKAQSRRHTQIGFPTDLRAACEQRALSRYHHDRAAAMRCLSRKTGEFGLIQF